MRGLDQNARFNTPLLFLAEGMNKQNVHRYERAL